jgi:hypothetical protein
MQMKPKSLFSYMNMRFDAYLLTNFESELTKLKSDSCLAGLFSCIRYYVDKIIEW